jgi:hypothetical protein
MNFMVWKKCSVIYYAEIKVFSFRRVGLVKEPRTLLG